MYIYIHSPICMYGWREGGTDGGTEGRTDGCNSECNSECNQGKKHQWVLTIKQINSETNGETYDTKGR